ncbi:MAG: DNA polymerase III subunit delta [Candidatus Omnitrophica bacterium CG1_02_46_14]|nr:MAG: DNA polymerase III subunit delta [Candidatus Omnitrophica bacterium CG1_02_46_14]
MVNPSPDPKGGAYLLYGKEGFLKREFIQNLRSEIFAKLKNSTMGFKQFEAPKDPLSAVIDFIGLQSFFDTQKLAVITGIDALEIEDKEKLLDYTQHLPKDSSLVLVSEESSVKKDHFLKKLAEKTKTIACHLPFDKDLPRWIENRVKKCGKTMDYETASVLIERVGKDAATLHLAIEQLAVYTDKKTHISSTHIEALLGRSVQADVFGLIDALLQRKIRSALEILEILLNEGAKIYEIVGAFSGQLERLARIKTLSEEGFPQDSIVEELKLHPFFAAKILKQADRLSKTHVQKMLKNLLICDEAVKTGRLNDRLALQRFILQACLDVT